MNSVRKPKSSRQDLLTATQTGDRMETLLALRDLLAKRLQESGSDRDIAAMSRRLMQCVTEIEALQAKKDAKSNNHLDDLRKQLNKNDRSQKVTIIANEYKGY